MNKIRLQCYHDEYTGRWGEMLHLFACADERFESTLFSGENDFDYEAGGYAFVHMHNSKGRREREKELLQNLAIKAPQVNFIPDVRHAHWYDDKVAQAANSVLCSFMPRTYTHDAELTLLPYPVLYKPAAGSGSAGIKLCKDVEDAVAVVSRTPIAAFCWQEFMPGNDYDYRAVSCGRYMMMLKRYNRSPEQPFASGSGKWEPITEIDSREREDAARLAVRIFQEIRLPWCGLDLIRNHYTGDWLLTEITIGWKLRAYYDCQWFVQSMLAPAPFLGCHTWQVLLQEISCGSFNHD